MQLQIKVRYKLIYHNNSDELNVLLFFPFFIEVNYLFVDDGITL